MPRALRRPGGASDAAFLGLLWMLTLLFAGLIVAMLAADAAFTTPAALWSALSSPEIRYSIGLSLLTCTIAAGLSLFVGVPAAYVLSRCDFPGRGVIDAIFDIPIVLPPLVIGLSLLILFQTAAGRAFETYVFPVTYEIPSVILAQFVVACAFAIRTMRVAFDRLDVRLEQVAMTLGCSRRQTFLRVVIPETVPGIAAAATIAWARALGEFGPILVFSGATRMKTEVMPTTVFLELSVGNIEAAIAVSLVMVLLAAAILGIARLFGSRNALA